MPVELQVIRASEFIRLDPGSHLDFEASKNEGFEMYRSIEHRADVTGHKFSYSDRNAFLITIVSDLPSTAPTKTEKNPGK